ncbi:hypothetical protein U1Q18_050716, partial [Sarracenia purpurea var. burkii]
MGTSRANAFSARMIVWKLWRSQTAVKKVLRIDLPVSEPLTAAWLSDHNTRTIDAFGPQEKLKRANEQKSSRQIL